MSWYNVIKFDMTVRNHVKYFELFIFQMNPEVIEPFLLTQLHGIITLKYVNTGYQKDHQRICDNNDVIFKIAQYFMVLLSVFIFTLVNVIIIHVTTWLI